MNLYVIIMPMMVLMMREIGVSDQDASNGADDEGVAYGGDDDDDDDADHRVATVIWPVEYSGLLRALRFRSRVFRFLQLCSRVMLLKLSVERYDG